MSAILSADDLNDFISPGAACIKPVEVPESTGEVEIQIDENGKPLQISKIDGKISSLAPAQISLSDCLACSGCITSAEEVLVAQHSHDQFLKALKENSKKFVVSISHQSRVSLANAFGYTVEEMDRMLISFFKDQMGVQFVVGTALGRKLSLLEESSRVIKRKLDHMENPQSPPKPILSSICPGWVLYAEKTHPHVLPFMSLVKSPQQITGCLLKDLAAKDLGCLRSDIYHLSIMPCFDKKLESARPEIDGTPEDDPDVNCVLTAKEFVQLLENSEYELFSKSDNKINESGKNINENEIIRKSVDELSSPLLITDLYTSVAPQGWPCQDLSWSNDSGSESGGYGYNYIHTFKEVLLRRDASIAPETLSVVTVEGKNSDIYELRLMNGDEKIASAAVVNGFRNIQNLVRKLKPSPGGSTKVNPLAAKRRARIRNSAKDSKQGDSKEALNSDDAVDASKADYVEVMACPNGCINGGGQISRPQGTPEKDWLSQAKEMYWQIGVNDVVEGKSLGETLNQWVSTYTAEAHIKHSRLYDTHFNKVEKPTDPATILLGSKW